MGSMSHKLKFLGKLDQKLMAHTPSNSRGIKRFILEFWFFGLINARSCLFAGFFFLALFLVPAKGILGLPRYDALLIFAVVFQAILVWSKLETWDELKAICVFHLVGFMMELFKTSATIASWQYPDAALTKLWGFLYLRGLCMLLWGVTLFNHGVFLKLELNITHPIGWQRVSHWRFILIFLAIIILTIIVGI